MQPKLTQNINYDGLEEHQKWFYHWIACRDIARMAKEMKLPPPWTDDPIIQNYRFCNVRREDDKVTKWIKTNWRDPYDGHPNMVTAMVVARLFNRETSLSIIKFPCVGEGKFDYWLEMARQNLKGAREMGAKIWTGAYLVSTNGHSMDKIDYILDRVVKPIHNHEMFRDSKPWANLENLHYALTQFDGMGSFMAGQVVADLKYTSVARNAEDWMTWAPIGPGSRRGLNRYHGRKLEGSIKTDQVLRELNVLKLQVQARLGIELPVHDIQNCLCEYDKHTRVRTGEGTPRSRYIAI